MREKMKSRGSKLKFTQAHLGRVQNYRPTPVHSDWGGRLRVLWKKGMTGRNTFLEEKMTGRSFMILKKLPF